MLRLENLGSIRSPLLAGPDCRHHTVRWTQRVRSAALHNDESRLRWAAQRLKGMRKMSMEIRHHIRPSEGAGTVVNVTPESAGWTYTGLKVVEVDLPGLTTDLHSGEHEMIFLPLKGSWQVTVDWQGEISVFELAGRTDVFTSATDFCYVPAQAHVSARSNDGGVMAITSAKAGAGEAFPPAYFPRSAARVEVRGAGSSTRQLTNYALANDVPTQRLLVCEAITPGGNWSSYPPHKHDTHSPDERSLEEIYFFQFRPACEEHGRAFHQVYGTADRPIDVLVEVRHNDTVLVPHGYHGPTATAPGYDLYGLNVMSGPEADGLWLSSDDPRYHWIRESWNGQDPDPRLPFFS